MNSTTAKLRLIDLSDRIKGEADVLICSGSYETRSVSIPTSLSTISFKKVFICYNTDHKEHVGKHTEIIRSLYPESGEYIELSSANQVRTADSLIQHIQTVILANEDVQILVDITTFRRQALLILLRVLRTLLTEKNRLIFAYSPASEYSTGVKDEEKWLSKNITTISSVLGYSGLMMPTRPLHLIILAGLEYERALSLISEYQPDAVSIGFPSKNSSKDFKHYQLNLTKVDQIKEEFPSANTFEFDCFDIHNTKEAIKSEVAKFSRFNNILSPMNNKLSTVACALVAFENKRVQICYAAAAFYNIENYSEPSEFCYIFPIQGLIKS